MENISDIVNINFLPKNISKIGCQNPTHVVQIIAKKKCNNCLSFMCHSCIRKDSNICITCSPDFDEKCKCSECGLGVLLYMCNNCGELNKYGHKIWNHVSLHCNYEYRRNLKILGDKNFCELCKN